MTKSFRCHYPDCSRKIESGRLCYHHFLDLASLLDIDRPLDSELDEYFVSEFEAIHNESNNALPSDFYRMKCRALSIENRVLKNRIAEIHMVERMKCCGNCCHYNSMIGQDKCISSHAVPWNAVQGDKEACEKWEFGL